MDSNTSTLMIHVGVEDPEYYEDGRKMRNASELIVLFKRRSHLASKAENRFSSCKIEVLTGDLEVSLDKLTLEYNLKSVETSYHISIISCLVVSAVT